MPKSNGDNPESRTGIRRSNGQFRKGQSGNPGGRTPLADEDRSTRQRVIELAREHTEAAILTIIELLNNPEQHGRTRLAAASEILDRGWGRAPQSIELSGPDAGLAVRVEWVKPGDADGD